MFHVDRSLENHFQRSIYYAEFIRLSRFHKSLLHIVKKWDHKLAKGMRGDNYFYS